jgi:type IV pilus assembly protein PilV
MHAMSSQDKVACGAFPDRAFGAAGIRRALAPWRRMYDGSPVPYACNGAARHARGMSLIECLVALVVLSVGLLGMAGLMLEGMRQGHVALLRTHAVNLVSDMSDRIRANPAAGSAYDCAAYARGPSERGCAATSSGSGTNCTAAELAEDDLARWVTQAGELLPLPRDEPCPANVDYVAPASTGQPARYHVSVTWRDPAEVALLTYGSDLLLAPLP